MPTLFGVFLTMGLGRTLSYRLLSMMGETFGVGSVVTGMFVLLMGIGMVVTLLLGGALADRFSKRTIFIVGLICMVAGSAGMAGGKLVFLSLP